MPYNQEANASPLPLEAPPPPPYHLNHLIAPPPPPVVPSYPPDTTPFFPPLSHSVLTSLDYRSRLGSNASSTGMAHAHRSTTLPHPHNSASTTRALYTPATPAFRRDSIGHHAPRSPSFSSSSRRFPLSPSSSSGGLGNYGRMDSYGPAQAKQNIPPLNSIINLGVLSTEDGTTVKIDINGSIDKGFFLSENEWTCYRRNYFSCICSFSLSPHYPNQTLHWVQNGHTQPYSVYGFAMCISAVVADNDEHPIDLVQHTPKRDKGPVDNPKKIRLTPRSPHSSHPHHHGHLGNLFTQDRGDYPFAGAQNLHPTEHTFERIQFKQATANNGKRRAAQQYYHLMVELWADVGNHSGEQFVKIAYRKSAKMIVRGRSPGHYQTERRNSSSSGPAAGAGSGLGGAPYVGGDYSSSLSLSSGYTTYERSSTYGGTRHHGEMSMNPILGDNDVKVLPDAGYHYYPKTLYDTDHQTGGHHVELYQPRSDTEAPMNHITTGLDKVKPEPEGLPSMFFPGNSYYNNNQRCGRFESKPTSNGYYPVCHSTASLNMTS